MMNNRFVLCSVLALILPLAGCDQKAPHTPPPAPQYGTPVFIQNPVIGADELYSLVSPIALFPDSLLTQVLAASTAPNDVAVAYSWQREHSTLKGNDLTLQAEMKSWSPAVKSLIAFPDVLAQMANNPQWMKFLGVAYTRQPQDVMNAVQILRARAQQNGALKTSPQLRVQSTPAAVTASAGKAVPAPAQTITIKPAQPGVIYVPVYPQTVYGNPRVIYYPGYVPPPSK
jgi:predicted small lipoprotein YifL